MEEKYKGPLAYLLGWLGGVIVLAAFKDNTKLTKFHACQSITISVMNLVVSLVLGFIPYVKYFAFMKKCVTLHRKSVLKCVLRQEKSVLKCV